TLWYLLDKERGTPLISFLALLPLFGGVLIYLFGYPWGHYTMLCRAVKGMVNEGKNRGLFTPSRLALTPNDITEANELVRTTTDWRAIEKINADEKAAYIYTNAVNAIMVPRRAFASSEKFEEFVRTAQNYHAEAIKRNG